ncbi:MAG TPA: hypothetical protein VFS39_10255 [Nitrospira sp.]|nr:hypothetical protein [Nitrospira sp.]
MTAGIVRAYVTTLLFAITASVILCVNHGLAEEYRVQDGGTEPGKVILGMRAGFAPVTQQVSGNALVPGGTSTDVGSLVNFLGFYSVNRWLLVGMMLEWERHGMSLDRTGADLGHQDTVSVLPTLEIRPVRFGPIVPYVNMSMGVNVNSFGEERNVAKISPSNTFAWRVGWGADWMLTPKFAVNTEMGYKRNDGHATLANGARVNDWNASSFGFLFGVKLFF